MLFAGQPNVWSTDPIAAQARCLGIGMTISTNGRFLVGGGFRVEAGVFPQRWQVWNEDTATLLLDLLTAALVPTGTGWWYFTFAQLSQAPYALSSGINYIPATYTPAGAGNYDFNTNNSYPFGQSPLAATKCIYRNNGTSSQIPNAVDFPTGRFGVDVVLDTPSTRRAPVLQTSRAAQQASRW